MEGMRIDESMVGIWFVTIPNGNMLAALHRVAERTYKLTYRFRYYKDDRAFDSADEKNWYSGTLSNADESYITDRISKAMATLRVSTRGEYHELLRGTKTFEEFKAEFFKLPFVHIKEVPV